MHHRNHHHSTANHNNPHHHQPTHHATPPVPSGRGFEKRGLLEKVRERFKEKPTTAEEVEQLGLKAKKETFKTQIYKAKRERPSGIGSLVFGGRSEGTPARRSASRQPSQESYGLGWGFESSNSGLMGSKNAEFGSGLNDMLGMGSGNSGRKKKYQKSGLEEMF